MRREEQHEFEAHVEAISALRQSAATIEGDEIYMVGEKNEKWEMSVAELRHQQRRASAMRALANELEIKTLKLRKNSKKRAAGKT